MNITNNYSALLNTYNQNVGRTQNTQLLETSNAALITPTANSTTQSTDTLSISQQAQEAYQALKQSSLNSLSTDDPNSDTLESILVSSMQASMQPFMQMIADKANSAASGSIAGISGAASPTGAISADWGSALDSLVSSGTLTQGQETSIETALNTEAQLKVSAEKSTSSPTASLNYINRLLV
ncbi:hypothetical protein [Desulfosporosinus sp. SB140]|uniref:hypothetical protein n=1 Tax=Desulfosporosinus paludis TaxID=3115649 RepID=UPI00388E49E3